MTTPITDAERALSEQIDEQGGRLAACRDKLIAAEAEIADWKYGAEVEARLGDEARAELARLRAVEPHKTAYALGWIAAASWAKRDDLLHDIGSPAYIAEMESSLQALAAPPAQPADAWRMAVDAAMVGHALDCTTPESDPAASVALLVKQVRDIWTEIATPAQPAEPVQRLSDERAAFEAWHNEYRTQELVRRDDTYYNTHARCRWEGWQARAIESALQPGWRPEWPAFVEYWTHESHLQTFADRERFREAAKAMLEAAPKATK